jgi:rRNA maturation RNase YbeY
MIEFISKNAFRLEAEQKTATWLEKIALSEDREVGEVQYVFCDDEQLLELNREFLDHDTYTDIIGFDYSVGKILQGEIHISTERVKENARQYDTSFENELRRVMAHGLLHFCGYKDKTKAEKAEIREKEDEKLKLFHVEQ